MKLSFLEMFYFGQFVFGIRFSNLYIHIDFVYCFRQTHEGNNVSKLNKEVIESLQTTEYVEEVTPHTYPFKHKIHLIPVEDNAYR